MKKIILLTLLLSSSISTFALELDFYSSESFCYESPKAQNRNGVFYFPNQQEPINAENLCVYSNGQYHSKGNIVNGKADGKWIWWHENGQKWEEGNFKDHQKDGKWISWHENGQKWQERNYIDGKIEGKHTIWFTNGERDEERNYKDGKADGKWILFMDEQIFSYREYKDGKEI